MSLFTAVHADLPVHKNLCAQSAGVSFCFGLVVVVVVVVCRLSFVVVVVVVVVASIVSFVV